MTMSDSRFTLTMWNIKFSDMNESLVVASVLH